MEANTKSSALELLTRSLEAVRLAEDDLREKVQLVRFCGASWTEIGAIFGISKQAAQQRFGKNQ